jgi:hypothetical protein
MGRATNLSVEMAAGEQRWKKSYNFGVNSERR